MRNVRNLQRCLLTHPHSLAALRRLPLKGAGFAGERRGRRGGRGAGLQLRRLQGEGGQQPRRRGGTQALVVVGLCEEEAEEVKPCVVLSAESVCGAIAAPQQGHETVTFWKNTIILQRSLRRQSQQVINDQKTRWMSKITEKTVDEPAPSDVTKSTGTCTGAWGQTGQAVARAKVRYRGSAAEP